MEGWKRRGWKTQEGAPVSNSALWQSLETAMTARRVAWQATKGREIPELEALGSTARAAAAG
jgi:ribonuclease HI